MIIELYLASLITLARDDGRYAQGDPAIKKWIEELKDKKGISCCNTADGFDAQWDTKDGHYRVFIEGQWIVIEKDQLLDDIPNKLGIARVWWIPSWDKGKMIPKVRCFLPGAGG